MNKLIKELADQSHVTAVTTKGYPGVVDGCYIISPDKLGKFAEAIVMECALVVNKKTGPKSALNVLDHFGIEE